MMVNPGSNPGSSGPGGFGKPVGGGGEPQKKPGGPEPSKGHYVHNKLKRKRTMTDEEEKKKKRLYERAKS